MPSDLQIAYFLQQAANAVPLAALYSLLAFGYALTFGLTRRAEFTAGTLFAFAGQLLLFFTALGYDRLWLVFPAALALGAVVAFAYTLLAGWVFGARVLRPLAFVSPNAVIVASLALMILLMELVRIASGNRELWLPPLFNTRVTLWNDPAYPVVTTVIQLANVALMVLAVTGGCLLLARTEIGRRWRSVCEDRLAAELLGVNTSAVMVFAALGTAAASALAGILATAHFGSMDFGSGLMFGLKVVMIASVGDPATPWRSAAGAALFGVVETFWGGYVSFVWRDLAMFSMLVAIAVISRRAQITV